MFQKEQQLHQLGFERIAGVDEAGRGSLAGPLVAAAVILPPNYQNQAIQDSKILSALQREKLFVEITHIALSYKIVSISSKQIDGMGILPANKLAMRKAVLGLLPGPDFILLDALTINVMAIPQMGIIDGDATIQCIAAASILAKVYRDRLMTEYHLDYPDYGFDQHKGYGTLKHRINIKAYGLSQIHRKSFTLKE